MKKTFARREIGPHLSRSAHDAVLRRIVENHPFEQIEQQLRIEHVTSGRLRGAICRPMTFEITAQHGVEDLAVDREKVALHVEFEHPARPRIIARTTADMMIEPPNGVKRPHPFSARIGVGDEGPLEKRSDLVMDQTVNDAIPEIRSENLAFDLRQQETNAARRIIPTRDDVVVKLQQLVLHIQLVAELIDRIAFAFPDIEIRLE